MAAQDETSTSYFIERDGKRRFGGKGFLAVCGMIALAVTAGALNAYAQSAALLLGNPQMTPGLQAQGYVITDSVSQTASSTSITYNVTPPAGSSPDSLTTIGAINLEGVLPSGSFITNVTLNVTFTGGLEVVGAGNFPFNPLGAGAGGSPQQKTEPMFAGRGSIAFALAAGTTSASSLTITMSIGNPSGARPPYLNDFLGDEKTNIGVWRPTEGNWYIFNGSASPGPITFGQSGDIPVPGDFDGDGLSDYAIWRPSEGNFYIRLSGTSQTVVERWGQSGDVPVTADYDGDGKTDLAIWRPGDGSWWIKLSSTGQTTVGLWGQSGDIPVPGDYDGDGKADLAISRPSTGSWWIRLSSTGETRVDQWGLPSDVPVPGDYDGDGRYDLAIWRPSDGSWWISRSSSGQTITAYWGASSDIPVPGDYDGDGKNDYAVWRPSEGTWYLNTTSGGAQSPVAWGASGDLVIGKPLGLP